MTQHKRPIKHAFDRAAHRATRAVGTTWAFFIAVAAVILWAVSGPFFGFSNTWQLIINTATTVATVLMVFLIQHTQNKDGMAIQMKLNEILAAIPGASNRLIDAEDLDEEGLEELRLHYQMLADRVAKKKQQRATDPPA